MIHLYLQPKTGNAGRRQMDTCLPAQCSRSSLIDSRKWWPLNGYALRMGNSETVHLWWQKTWKEGAPQPANKDSHKVNDQ